MFGSKKRKQKKHEAELLEQYEAGKILQVDGKTDNKEHFAKLDNQIKGINNEIAEIKKEVQKEVQEEVEETNLEDLPPIEPPNTELPGLEPSINDLIIKGKGCLVNEDIEGAKEIYKEIKELYNPEEDKELYPQILDYYNEIVGGKKNE